MKTDELIKIQDKIDLFYFSKNKELLIIPNYYINGSSGLTTLINNLTDIESFISHYSDNVNNKVYCSELGINKRFNSNKWKFWCEFPSHLELPNNTTIIDNLDMNVWLY